MKLTPAADFLSGRMLGETAERYCPPLWRAMPGSVLSGDDNGRVIRYVLSDQSVARDGHTIATAGWELGNYLKNPVVLWAHDSAEPPIGRMVEIGASGGRLMGSVEYPDPDVYPFADTVYRLVKGGYLNAVSVSWLPIEWKFSQDRARPGGIDFIRSELLEVSQVPVPALPSALVDARAAGIDTCLLYEWAERVLDGGEKIVIPRTELETLRRAAKMPTPRKRADAADWKVGAARDLSIDTSDSWDGAAAKASIFEYAGGDDFDAAKARKGFLLYDAAKPKERGSYKEPFARAVDGELKAVEGGVRAAADRLPQTDVPQDVKDSARSVLDHYESKMKAGNDRSGPIATLVRQVDSTSVLPPKKRGLGMAACLLVLLDQLYDFVNAVKAEAAYEGDDSPAPAALLAIANDLAAAAMSYATEEIAEEAEGEDVEIGPYYYMAAPEAERRAALAVMLRATYRGQTPAAVSQDAAAILEISGDAARVLAAALERKGRVHSAKTESALRRIVQSGNQTASEAQTLLDEGAEPDEPTELEDDIETQRAAAIAVIAAATPKAV